MSKSIKGNLPNNPGFAPGRAVGVPRSAKAIARPGKQNAALPNNPKFATARADSAPKSRGATQSSRKPYQGPPDSHPRKTI